MYVLAVGIDGDFFGECESIMINMNDSGKTERWGSMEGFFWDSLCIVGKKHIDKVVFVSLKKQFYNK